AEEWPTYLGGRRLRRTARALGGFLDAQVPRRADFCIAVSEELGATLRRCRVPDADLACISPVGDPTELGSLPRPGLSTGRVCYAGNLDGYQNLDFLRRSFARVRAAIPEARLVVVTHEGTSGTVPELATGAGIELVCARSYREVRNRLAEADVAVSPRAERSGFPMKLLNYMALGKAIVASAGAAKRCTDGVTGRVVPDGGEAAVA